MKHLSASSSTTYPSPAQNCSSYVINSSTAFNAASAVGAVVNSQSFPYDVTSSNRTSCLSSVRSTLHSLLTTSSSSCSDNPDVNFPPSWFYFPLYYTLWPVVPCFPHPRNLINGVMFHLMMSSNRNRIRQTYTLLIYPLTWLRLNWKRCLHPMEPSFLQES